MQDLLDIKEAAAFLRVSETSLRRWTNGGRLRCLRIGGRRERRFRREDLETFLASGPAPAASAGAHVCGFYTSPLNRLQDAAAFLSAAWAPDVRFVLVAAPEVQSEVLGRLERSREQLVLAEYESSPAAQLERWHTYLSAAHRDGFSRVVVVGDVSGGALGARSMEELVEYEAEFHRSIARRFPVTTLCQYDARMLSGVDVAQVLRGHQGTVTTYHSQH